MSRIDVSLGGVWVLPRDYGEVGTCVRVLRGGQDQVNEDAPSAGVNLFAAANQARLLIYTTCLFQHCTTRQRLVPATFNKLPLDSCPFIQSDLTRTLQVEVGKLHLGFVCCGT